MTSKPLISAAELSALVSSGNAPVIVDTRAPERYAEAHIPGAVNIHEIFKYLATSTDEGLRALRQTFVDLFGAAGIGGDETVVLYEDAMNTGYGQSCRGWFLLKYLGHPSVRVLHGGIRVWEAAGLPLTTAAPEPEPRRFTARIDDSIMVTWEQMLAALDAPGIVLVDTRDRDEWEGESSSPYGKDFAPRKGRIPGAVWIEWYRLMRDESAYSLFRKPEEVRAICAEAGITEESIVYLYCFKGARASNTMLALQEAGIRDVRLYFGSWNEWSRNPELPIDEGMLTVHS